MRDDSEWVSNLFAATSHDQRTASTYIFSACLPEGG